MQYVMPALEGIASKPKISFVRGIPDWQWYVGAGMYAEDLRELIETGQAGLQRQLRRKIIQLLPIFLGAGLLALAVSWLVYIRIRKERDIFGRFFQQAAESYETIDEQPAVFFRIPLIGQIEANAMLAAREKAMQDLQRSEERFKELAESLPETIFEMDLQGTLTFVNRRAFEQFGYSQQDFARGLSSLDMVIPADRARVMANIVKILETKTTSFNEYTALRKDGGTFACLIFSAPIPERRPVGRFAGIYHRYHRAQKSRG